MTAPYTDIVVGTDGSPGADCAVAAASAVAVALDRPLTVATVWSRRRPDAPPPSRAARYPASVAGMEAGWASDTVSAAGAVARDAGVEEVRPQTPEGRPAEALIELGRSLEEGLLVVGTRGLDSAAERLVGNIPHQLTHHATTDVLLVAREQCPAPVSWSSTALATDGSPTATTACTHGLALARALDATPTLLTVARSGRDGRRMLAGAAEQLDAPDCRRRVVTARRVAPALTEAAAEYDLLVIGNRGMSGPSRLLGSVSNRVTHHVPTDTLLVNTAS